MFEGLEEIGIGSVEHGFSVTLGAEFASLPACRRVYIVSPLALRDAQSLVTFQINVGPYRLLRCPTHSHRRDVC